MKVKNILENKKRRGEILSVDTTSPLADAIKIMVKNDTGSVAVYANEAFVGMLTFREILIAIANEGPSAIDSVPCSEVVEKDGPCASPEDGVDQIRNLMTSKHVRYLPVVTDGKLTDIISFYDVARSVAKAADYENRLLKEYISDWPISQE